MSKIPLSPAVENWIGRAKHPVAVVGPHQSVFTKHLVDAWREIGLDVRLIGWPDGEAIPLPNRAAAAVLRRTLFVERALQSIERKRYERAMGSESVYEPMIFRSLIHAASVGPSIRAMEPLFVCGLEVFAHGATVAACAPFPRVLMPWGGDIYMYGRSTTLANAVVGHALRSVELVAPGSPRAAEYVAETYGAARGRMYEHGGFWRLDRSRFTGAAGAERAAIRARYSIPADALLILNARRSHPAWGGDVAVDAFLTYARENENAYFVLIGGMGGDVAPARHRIAELQLERRFVLLEDEIPLSAWSEIVSASDIFVSLMRENDLRPLAGVLEPAAAGAAPILSDQGEYRDMEALGFSAIFVRPDATEVIAALRSYASSPEMRDRAVRANLEYIDRHENGGEQMAGLLDRIRIICETRAGTGSHA